MEKHRSTQTLGSFLKGAREKKGLSLRGVEDEVDISNAYLSQLEGGKIKQPSPVVLHKLSDLYKVSYAAVMTLAGYPVPKLSNSESTLHARLGPTTEDEEDAIVDYIEFLRSKRKKGGR